MVVYLKPITWSAIESMVKYALIVMVYNNYMYIISGMKLQVTMEMTGFKPTVTDN